MKRAWFKGFGGFTFQYWFQGVVFLVAVVFCIDVSLAIDSHSHSASDTLYGVFPFFACTFPLVDWIARSTSRP
jgi:hypothetical protein